MQLLNCIISLCGGSHYSLGLICNDWLSSTSQPKMGSFIDYTQTEKKNPGDQHKILIIRNYLLGLFHLSSMSFTLILVMNFSTPSPPAQEYAIDHDVSYRQLQACAFTYWCCSYWFQCVELCPSCVGDLSTLTGLLYQHPSQALTNNLHQDITFN